MIEVATELPVVVALDPGDAVRGLHATLVDRVEGAEIVAEGKCVRQVDTGLSGSGREVVMAPSVLHQRGIHQGGSQQGIECAVQGLVAQESVMSTARRADAAAVKGIADQHIQVARVQDRIVQCCAIIIVNLVVEASETSVVVERLQNVQVLGRQVQSGFCRIHERHIVWNT